MSGPYTKVQSWKIQRASGSSCNRFKALNLEDLQSGRQARDGSGVLLEQEQDKPGNAEPKGPISAAASPAAMELTSFMTKP